VIKIKTKGELDHDYPFAGTNWSNDALVAIKQIATKSRESSPQSHFTRKRVLFELE
jgi:hypothetical protein